MNFLKAAAFAAPAILFAACSSDSPNSSPEASAQESSTTNPVETPTFSVTSCGAVSDAALIAKIDGATTTVLDGFADGDYDEWRTNVSAAKASFKEVLAENPSSCEAQFGLALTLVADVVNNAEIVDIVNTLRSDDDDAALLNLFHVDYKSTVSTAMSASVKSSTKLVTDRVQSVLANAAIPAVDSAITYMQSVVSATGFEYKVQYEEENVVLGHGEFLSTLGAARALKAAFTAVASINLNAAKDDSYNWVAIASEWLDDESGYPLAMNDDQKTAFNHFITLTDKNSGFSTIDSKWKSAYTAIPVLLDSAITNVKDGFQYMLNQSATVRTDDYRALVVIGDGEESDISTRDMQKSIDVVDSLQRGIRGVVTVKINNQLVDVDARKFFNITDGFQEYLPYHQFTSVDSWADVYKDENNLAWVEYDYRYDYVLFAENSIKAVLDSVLGAGYDMWYSMTSVDYEDAYGNYGWARIYWDGCSYIFENSSYEDLALMPEGVVFTVAEDRCKSDGTTTLFKGYSEDLMPNFFNFTDASGNVTASYTDFAMIDRNGMMTADYFARTVIFPDPTFGGVFPSMTQSSLARLFVEDDD